MKLYSEETLFAKMDEVGKYQWVEWVLLALLQMHWIVELAFGVKMEVPLAVTVVLFTAFMWLVIMRNVRLAVLHLLFDLNKE